MFKRIKEISKTDILGIVYQLKYLINEKHATDKALAWHLQNILIDRGIPVDEIELLKPWEWTKEP